MGIRAERLTGYFCTSASKRAASCGEKIDMVSDSLLMHQLPRPRLCSHIHFFLSVIAEEAPALGQLEHAVLSIFAAPGNLSTPPVQLQPCVSMAHLDPFFPQF